MPIITPGYRKNTKLDYQTRGEVMDAGTAEYLGAEMEKATQGASWFALSREAEITTEERKTYDALPPEDRALSDADARDMQAYEGRYQGMFPDPAIADAAAKEQAKRERVELGLEKVPAMTREEYENSAWFREGIPWQENLSPVRARIQAEHFDHERYLDELIKSRDGDWMMKAAGLGAGFLVGMADPINYVPIFGPAAKGAAVTRGAFKTIGRAALRGAAENLITGAAVEAVNRKYLEKYGEDVTFADSAISVAFDTALGALFGAAGSAWRVAKARKSVSASARKELGRALEYVQNHVEEHGGEGLDVGKVISDRALVDELRAAAFDGPMADAPDAPATIGRMMRTADAIRTAEVDFNGPGRAVVDAPGGRVELSWDRRFISPAEASRTADVMDRYEPHYNSTQDRFEWKVEDPVSQRALLYADAVAPDGSHNLTIERLSSKDKRPNSLPLADSAPEVEAAARQAALSSEPQRADPIQPEAARKPQTPDWRTGKESPRELPKEELRTREELSQAADPITEPMGILGDETALEPQEVPEARERVSKRAEAPLDEDLAVEFEAAEAEFQTAKQMEDGYLSAVECIIGMV